VGGHVQQRAGLCSERSAAVPQRAKRGSGAHRAIAASHFCCTAPASTSVSQTLQSRSSHIRQQDGVAAVAEAQMRAKTLQIIWHEKQPVFSVDFHPNGYLATGGADREIKVRAGERAAGGDQPARETFKRNCLQERLLGSMQLLNHSTVTIKHPTLRSFGSWAATAMGGRRRATSRASMATPRPSTACASPQQVRRRSTVRCSAVH